MGPAAEVKQYQNSYLPAPIQPLQQHITSQKKFPHPKANSPIQQQDISQAKLKLRLPNQQANSTYDFSKNPTRE